MSKFSRSWGMSLRLVPRIVVLSLLVTAPVLAMANTGKLGGPFIEHVQKRNSGVGFVILVSLQR